MSENANFTFKQFIVDQNIGRTKGYELVHDPSFYPAFRIGRKILINREKLRRWNEEQNMNKGDQS